MAKNSHDAEGPATPRSKTSKEAKNVDDEVLSNRRVARQVRAAVRIPENARKAVVEDERAGALALVRGLKPGDWAEAMLAAQMVAVHTAAMDCAHHAMNTGSFEVREQMLRYMAKLAAVYPRQMEALGKYRGKGQQNIRVEHVNVAAGGRAIVGNVAVAGKPLPSCEQSKPAPREITRASEVPFEMTENVREPVKQREKADGQDDP